MFVFSDLNSAQKKAFDGSKALVDLVGMTTQKSSWSQSMWRHFLRTLPNLLNCILDPDTLDNFDKEVVARFGETAYFKHHCLLGTSWLDITGVK